MAGFKRDAPNGLKHPNAKKLAENEAQMKDSRASSDLRIEEEEEKKSRPLLLCFLRSFHPAFFPSFFFRPFFLLALCCVSPLSYRIKQHKSEGRRKGGLRKNSKFSFVFFIVNPSKIAKVEVIIIEKKTSIFFYSFISKIFPPRNRRQDCLR